MKSCSKQTFSIGLEKDFILTNVTEEDIGKNQSQLEFLQPAMSAGKCVQAMSCYNLPGYYIRPALAPNIRSLLSSLCYDVLELN